MGFVELSRSKNLVLAGVGFVELPRFHGPEQRRPVAAAGAALLPPPSARHDGTACARSRAMRPKRGRRRATLGMGGFGLISLGQVCVSYFLNMLQR
jgi:hypothetical protein